jgi:hypothetical protein
MQVEFILERTSVNKLNVKKMKEQLKFIKQAADRYNVNAKFGGRLKPQSAEGETQNYRYTVKLRVSSDSTADDLLDRVENAVRKATELQRWRFVGQAGFIPAELAQAARPAFVVPKLDDEAIQHHFSGLFSRDAHLRVIHDATEMYVNSQREYRSHTVLYGEPGAAKTVMFEMLKGFYELNSPVERVHIVDGTSLTKAGLENYLLDRAEAGELPEILVIEEIEKKDLKDVFCLGAIMDGRGTIQKLNAKVNRKSTAKMLVWCTCNSEEFLINFHKGYLWSRFTHKLECVRPARDEMYKILLDKIDRMGGNHAWAKPALDFAYDVMGTDDPREICGLLDGRNRLLDGSYQRDRSTIILAARQARERKAKPKDN